MATLLLFPNWRTLCYHMRKPPAVLWPARRGAMQRGVFMATLTPRPSAKTPGLSYKLRHGVDKRQVLHNSPVLPPPPPAKNPKAGGEVEK